LGAWAVAIWCAAVASASPSVAYFRFPLTGHFDSLSTTIPFQDALLHPDGLAADQPARDPHPSSAITGQWGNTGVVASSARNPWTPEAGRGFLIQAAKFALHGDFRTVCQPGRGIPSIALDTKQEMKSNIAVDTVLQLEKARRFHRPPFSPLFMDRNHLDF
jgi:hypothetical protein